MLFVFSEKLFAAFTSNSLSDIVGYYWFRYCLDGRVMHLQKFLNIRKTVNIKLTVRTKR